MKFQRIVQLETAERRTLREKAVPHLTIAYPDLDVDDARVIRSFAGGNEMTAERLRRVVEALEALREICERESDPGYWEVAVPGTGGSGLVLDHEVARATLAEARQQQVADLTQCIEIAEEALRGVAG